MNMEYTENVAAANNNTHKINDEVCSSFTFDNIVSHWQTFGCGVEFDNRIMPFSSEVDNYNNDTTTTITNSTEEERKAEKLKLESEKHRLRITPSKSTLVSNTMLDYTLTTSLAIRSIFNEVEGVSLQNSNVIVNRSTKKKKEESNELPTYVSSLELLSLVIESPSLMETLVQLYAQFTQQYKITVDEQQQQQQQQQQRKLEEIVARYQAEETLEKELFVNDDAKNKVTNSPTGDDNKKEEARHECEEEITNLIKININEAIKLQTEWQSAFYDVMRTAVPDTMANVLTHMQSSHQKETNIDHWKSEAQYTNTNIVNSDNNNNYDVYMKKFQVDRLSNDIHVSEFASCHVPVQTILMQNPLLEREMKRTEYVDSNSKIQNDNIKSSSSSSSEKCESKCSKEILKEQITKNKRKVPLTMQSHSRRLDRALQPIVFDLSPVSCLLDCLCSLDAQHKHRDTNEAIEIYKSNTSVTDCYVNQPEEPASSPECKEASLNAIQSHLMRLACGQVDLLWLIGTKEDAIALLNSIKLPELLLTESTSFKREYLPLESVLVSSSSQMPRAVIDSFVHLLSSSSSTSLSSSSFYITYTTRLWGAQIILLWEPAWLEKNQRADDNNNNDVSSEINYEYFTSSDDYEEKCIEQTQWAVETVMHLAYNWRVSMLNVAFLSTDAVYMTSKPDNSALDFALTSNNYKSKLERLQKGILYKTVISAMSMCMAKIMTSSCTTTLSEMWPTCESYYNKQVYLSCLSSEVLSSLSTVQVTDKVDLSRHAHDTTREQERDTNKCNALLITPFMSSPLRHPSAIGAREKHHSQFTTREVRRSANENTFPAVNDVANCNDNNNNEDSDETYSTPLETARKNITHMWESTTKNLDWTYFTKSNPKEESLPELLLSSSSSPLREHANKSDEVCNNDANNMSINMSLTFNTPIAVRLFLPLPVSMFDKSATYTDSVHKSNNNNDNNNRDGDDAQVTSNDNKRHKHKTAAKNKSNTLRSLHRTPKGTNYQNIDDNNNNDNAQNGKGITTPPCMSDFVPLNAWLIETLGNIVEVLEGQEKFNEKKPSSDVIL